jgi:hypothetical protein
VKKIKKADQNGLHQEEDAVGDMPPERAYRMEGDICKTYVVAKGRKYALSYERKVVDGKWVETDRLELPIYC